MRPPAANYSPSPASCRGDLCFLDRRDADWEQERSGLQSHGKSGVAGPFEALFGSRRC
jgi:hypothetical protein